MAEEKQVQTEDKEEKRVQSVPNNVRPGVMRKRSYSFSDGNFRSFRKYLSVPEMNVLVK